MSGTATGWRHALLCACLVLGVAVGMASAHADGPAELSRSDAAALVRATFVRLNDANQTADYAMLRATAAPGFQKRFDERELTNLFAGMREKRIDLAGAVALEPMIETARFHTGQNVLQLVGFVPTRPVRTRFGFSFQKRDGVWKLYGLMLDFEAAPKTSGSAPST